MNWRAILSGTQQGLCAASIRALLKPLSWLYGKWMERRNRRYDSDRATIQRVPCPVISIGNLTTGGTGKTPFVIWLCEWLRHQGLSPAVISRGYGAAAGQLNDEGMEIANRLPGILQKQHPDRVASAQALIAEADPDVLLLDDGFQHRRLHRDCDLVLIDATAPWGFGYCLPRGMLREPLEGLGRAQVLVLTRSDAVSQDDRLRIKDRALKFATQALWVETIHHPTVLVNRKGERKTLLELKGKPVFLFCAIGNPQAFFRTVANAQADIRGQREFIDHHRYVEAELDAISQAARDCNAKWLICTEKDLVKLKEFSLPDELELWCLRIELQVISGERELKEKLLAVTQA